MIKVAVTKVNGFDYNYEGVERGMSEALALIGGIDKYINPGERVLIKPNMLEAVDKGLELLPIRRLFSEYLFRDLNSIDWTAENTP